jgi:predicted NACHT family NTPase
MLQKFIADNDARTAVQLIVEQIECGKLTKFELKTKIFGEHWRDESWHELLRLIVGSIDANN